MLDPIDQAALVLLDSLAARIRDGSVVVTTLGAVDNDAQSLALGWMERPAAPQPEAASAATTIRAGCCAKPKPTPLPDGTVTCMSCGAETES